MIVPAEQISKPSTLILQRAKAIVEKFHYLLRALCIDQECQFAMAPDFFFLLSPFEISVSCKTFGFASLVFPHFPNYSNCK